MKKLKVDWIMLEAAFDDASMEHSHYLDLQTGEVLFISDDERRYLEQSYEAGEFDDAADLGESEPEPEPDNRSAPDWEDEGRRQARRIAEDTTDRYVAIPPADSREGYRDMEDFIDTLSDERLQELLSVAIQGSGAFRRFKDVLARYPVERERYFKFKDQRVRERMMEWLNSLDIEPIEGPRRS